LAATLSKCHKTNPTVPSGLECADKSAFYADEMLLIIIAGKLMRK